MAAAADNKSVDCADVLDASINGLDYRTATAQEKYIVESYHFTRNVELLQSGATGSLGADIAFTLRAFPNHPRALMAMIRLGQRDRTSKPVGSIYPVECWIDRAMRFRPDDLAIRQIRGVYSAMEGKYDPAIADLALVLKDDPDNASAHYNLGLAYFGKRDYESALAEAKRAYALGFALQGLKEKLRAKGKWTD